jgi:ribosomal protein S18 acetylase RimI-like enzyme
MENVRKASWGDINNVVKIHIRAFPKFFLTQLGPNFLNKYYELVLTYNKNIFLVAERDGYPIGFVAGFLEPSKYYLLIKKHKIDLGKKIISALIKKPKLINRIISNFRKINRLTDEEDKKIVELASIAVDPDYSGKGVGRILIKSFLEGSKKMGAEFVYLTTDAKNNDAVNYFYLSMGFKLYKTFMAAPDRAMNEYRYYFNK